MKQLAFFLALILSVGCLLGCGANFAKTDYLAWQETPFSATGTAIVNGISYDVRIDRTPSSTVITTVTENGMKLVFSQSGASAQMEADGVSVPLPKACQGGIPALLSFFSLSRTDLTSVKQDKAGDLSLTLVSFTLPSGALTVTLVNKTGFPSRIEADLDTGKAVLHIQSFQPSAEK